MATTAKENQITVFLAWQSDLDKKFTRNAIRSSLNAAVTRIANDENGPGLWEKHSRR